MEEKETKKAAKRIRVRATQDGYYDHVLRRDGDVFTIKSETEFSTRWMERVPMTTPESVTGSNAELARQHDTIMRDRAAMPVLDDDDPLGAGR